MGKKLRSSSGTNNGGQKSPVKEAVMWTESMNVFLIDSLLHQQAIGNRVDRNFTSMAYHNIVEGIHDKFGIEIEKQHIKNRLKSIKDNFHDCYDLFGQHTGFSWSPMTKTWNAEPQVWKAFLEEKPEAKKWTTKTINHYDRLVELFGRDRDKRLSAETPRDRDQRSGAETPKEKARRWTRSNGPKSAGIESADQMVNEDEVPGEVMVAKRNKSVDKSTFQVSDVVVTKRSKSADKSSLPIAEEVVTKRNKSIDKFMEIDLSQICNAQTGLVAIPVPAGSYGKGLPYAPVDWPCPGDMWSWKVGQRYSVSGHWLDRYLYPPSRFRDFTGKKAAFQSRLQVEEYIRKEYPDIDPSTFFSSFLWKIPAEGHTSQKGIEQDATFNESKSESTDSAGGCKARNKMCRLQKVCRLQKEGTSESSPAKDCDICCTEAGFCHECCCILCCKTIDSGFGGYSHIKCEAIVEENYICGHVAHIECALRCYMAGTVGGSIGLDVEYYCRRCDNKTDLMHHVTQLVKTCESLESRDEVEPILNMGLCILRGSKQMRAKSLENYLGSALAKLKCGVDLAEIWKMEDHMPVHTSGEIPQSESGIAVLGAQPALQGKRTLEYANLVESLPNHETNGGRAHWPVYITSDHSNVSVKLEDEVDHALQELKKSQEAEYGLAEQKLYSQKDFLLGLYRLLDSERSELADPKPLSNGGNCDALLSNVLNRVDQIKSEEEKIRSMMKIANGFGRTPKSILQEHFGIAVDN